MSQIFEILEDQENLMMKKTKKKLQEIILEITEEEVNGFSFFPAISSPKMFLQTRPFSWPFLLAWRFEVQVSEQQDRGKRFLVPHPFAFSIDRSDRMRIFFSFKE
jgi:hypothetical protein